MSKCVGCGVTLQSVDKDALGYTPKEDAKICQRCFRLSNYGEFRPVINSEVTDLEILKQVSAQEGTVLWVIDLFDLDACLIENINDILENKIINIVITKVDLLPKSLKDGVIIKYLLNYFKEKKIKFNRIFIKRGAKDIDELFENVLSYSPKKPIIVIGKANAGKSTLLNQFNHDKILTSSRYPNTTLDFNPIEIKGYIFIDTRGFSQVHSYLNHVSEENLKYIIPMAPIKQRVYQIYEDQSFAIGGLVRLDLSNVKNASIVFNISNALQIHRGKKENADALWDEHYGKLLIPIADNKYEEFKVTKFKEKNHYDLVIHGLGWIKISGKDLEVEIYHHQDVNVLKRKVLL